MKKLLLLPFLALIFISQKSNAQWTETSTLKNITWEYNFTGTPGTVDGQGGITKTSTPSAEDFLPKPASGEVKIIALAATEANSTSFTLNDDGTSTNTSSSLTVVHNKDSKSGKFVAMKFADAAVIMSAHFDLKLNNTVGNTVAAWYIVVGGDASTTFSTANPASVGNGSQDNNVYTMLRIRKATGNTYEMHARYHTSTTAMEDWGWQFVKSGLESGSNLKIDMYCNNHASGGATYNVDNNPHTLAAMTYNIWINGEKQVAGNLVRNIRRHATGSTQHTGVLNAVGIMTRDAAKSGTVSDNSASIEINNLKVVHLGTLTTNPVTFADFTGKATNNGVALNWQTSSESNNSHFIVKRSASGSDFSYLGRTDAKGNGTSTAVNNYSFTDNNPVAGTNYYQLVQVDKDGTESEFNKVLAIDYGVVANALSVTKVSDNNLKITLNADKAETSEIMITDIAGKIIYKGKRMLRAGVNELEVSFSGASHKVSVVRVQTPTSSKSTKIVL